MRSLLLFFIALFFSGCAHTVDLKQNIWKVETDEGSCTGFQVNGGFLVTAAHCVLDKNHVVFKKDEVVVIAELRRLDPESDVAVFFSDSLSASNGFNVACYLPRFGDDMFALGYPGALGNTLISQKISLIDQDPEHLFLVRSLDGKVWQGMSGGPLVDQYGNVFGVIHGFQLVNHSNQILAPAIMKIDLYSTGTQNELFCKNLQ